MTSLNKSIPPPTPTEGVVKRVDPSSVDPSTREKRRKLLVDTRAAFNNEVPTPFYVTCWAGLYDNLQFIMAQSFREMMTSPRKRPMNGACGTLEPKLL